MTLSHKVTEGLVCDQVKYHPLQGTLCLKLSLLTAITRYVCITAYTNVGLVFVRSEARPQNFEALIDMVIEVCAVHVVIRSKAYL